MDKLKMAHDHMMAMIKAGCSDGPDLLDRAWCYADAMQAEADKREPSGLPEALCEVGWNQAVDNTIAWFMLRGSSSWLLNDFRIVCAPSFGFTGSHIVERPDGF